MMVLETRRWRLALFAFMFVVGVGMASWVTRTPAVRDAVDVSTAGVGLVLFGLSVGSMLGVMSSGRLVVRFGTRPVIATGAGFLVAGVAAIAAGTAAGLASGAFAGLLLFGIGGGLSEIALNIDGAEVEVRLGRPVLPALHGCFSLGTLVGAVAGIALTWTGFPAAWHLAACAVLMTVVAVWAYRALPGGVGAKAPDADAVAPGPLGATATARNVWRDPCLLLLGVVLLALAFAEGSANDWLPLLTVDGLGLTATQGSMVFAAFAAVMTVGRFSGRALVNRFGKQGVLVGSVLTSAVGIALVALAAQPAVVVTGVALWGLGASLGFPVAISVAGESPDRPAARVSAVATAGYLAFLVGPPVLGFLGEQYGLRAAILVVVALLAVAAVAEVARGRVTNASAEEPVTARVHEGAHR